MDDIYLKAEELLRERRVAVFKGRNFSGRTALLRKISGLDRRPEENQRSPATYIGPEVVSAISGLASTVQEEITLHCRNAESLRRATCLGEHLGISHLYNSNPFNLSGGEQVALALVTSVALEPAVLAVDSALEQLTVALRRALVSQLRTGSYPKTVLADNRLSEFSDCFCAEEVIEILHLGEAASDFKNCKIRSLMQQNLGPSFSCHVSLEGLYFSYVPGRIILQDVSLHLEPGNVYHLAGANGAGKSTLAKILAGVLRPRKGNIWVNKSRTDPWLAPGQLVSYSFQNPDLQLFSSTVWDEISAGLKKDRADRRDIASMALSAFGLEDLKDFHPLDLPFVLRKRLALAIALGSGKPWIILDEPNLGQDDEATSAIANLIDAYREQGGGVLLISHSASLFEKLNPRPILLENGRIQ